MTFVVLMSGKHSLPCDHSRPCLEYLRHRNQSLGLLRQHVAHVQVCVRTG